MLEQWKRKRDMIGGVEVVLLASFACVHAMRSLGRGRNVSHSSNLYVFSERHRKRFSQAFNLFDRLRGGCLPSKIIINLKKKNNRSCCFYLIKTDPGYVCVCAFIVKNPFFRDLFRRTDSLLSPQLQSQF